jgi:hypothetical protein
VAALLTRHERRRAPRLPAPRLGLADAALVRPGVVVSFIVVSAVGALVESPSALRPGTRTEIALDAIEGERWLVGVQVMRCWVARLDPVRYRAAIAFDRPISRVAGSGYPDRSGKVTGSRCP